MGDGYHELYGCRILQATKRPLVRQVYEVLCREIELGRWKPEDRLPSIGALAEETGLGASPIRQAYERLRSEGYVRQEGRNGTVLITSDPKGGIQHGVIGVVVPSRMDRDGRFVGGAANRRFHAIVDAAKRRNWVAEATIVRHEDDLSSIDTADGPFSDRVRGIISLEDFPRPYAEILRDDMIPCVFFLDPAGRYREVGGDSLPAVTGDLFAGFYLATKEALTLGHRDVVFYGAGSRTPRYTQDCWLGHKKAMEEGGARVNQEALDKSLAMSETNLPSAKVFLEAFPEATAIICETMMMASNLVAVADLTGIRVPGDLSIIGHGYGNIRPGDEALMTCIQYDLPRAAETSLDLLFEQMKTRFCPVTTVTVRPVVQRGSSLAPPPREPRNARRGASPAGSLKHA